MQEEKMENDEEKVKKRNGAKFAGAFLVTCMMAASFFILWAWISYEKKLSAEVIRAGLTVIYFLPCMIGGKIVKRIYGSTAWVIALLLGTLFFGLLYVCSLFQRQEMPGFSNDMIPVLFLSMAGALSGAVSSRKSSQEPKKP